MITTLSPDERFELLYPRSSSARQAPACIRPAAEKRSAVMAARIIHERVGCVRRRKTQTSRTVDGSDLDTMTAPINGHAARGLLGDSAPSLEPRDY